MHSFPPSLFFYTVSIEMNSGLKWQEIQAHMQNISLFLPTCSCINQRSFRGNRRLVFLRCGFYFIFKSLLLSSAPVSCSLSTTFPTLLSTAHN